VGAVPPGTDITNTAIADYEMGGSTISVASNSVVTTTVGARTDAVAEFMRYDVALGTPEFVDDGQLCSSSGDVSGPFGPMPDPVDGSGSQINLDALVGLLPNSSFGGGEAAFVRITDPDQNVDPAVLESVQVRYWVAATGDFEAATLVETGVDTGVFIGSILFTNSSITAGDCALAVSDGVGIVVEYADPADVADVARAMAYINSEDAGLFVTKRASKTGVELGEFLQYWIRVESSLDSPLAQNAFLVDTLPFGFRYQTGSARLGDGTPITPVISGGGRELRFDLGDITPGTVLDVSYVVAVTTASNAKRAVNRAIVLADYGLASNLGSATVTVLEDRPSERVLIMGRVTLDECGTEIDALESGVPSVRLYLEDGTFVVTDERGLFHIEGLPPGVHLVQLDADTLPEGYEPISCEGESSHARQPLSQFVDAQPGSLWRTDFHLRRIRGNVSQQLRVERLADRLHHSLDVKVGKVGVPKITAVVMLPDGVDFIEGSASLDGDAVEVEPNLGTLSFRLPDPDPGRSYRVAFSTTAQADRVPPGGTYSTRAVLVGVGPSGEAVRSPVAEAQIPQTTASSTADSTSDEQHVEIIAPLADLSGQLAPPLEQEARVEDRFDKFWIEQQEPGRDWVYPPEDFIPGIASLKLGVLHHPHETVELLLDGARVSPFNYDGTLLDKDKRIAMSRWRGVDLRDGANRFEAIFRDEQGVEVHRIKRTIHFTGGPAIAELVEEESHLVADGRSYPVIAVRMKDRTGRLVRPGVTGHFDVDTPYQSREQVEQLRKMPITRLEEVQPTYVVGKDGIARIQLHPTSVVGEVRLKFRFHYDTEEEIEAWLSPGDRDWVLVAVADGTLGYNHQSGDEAHLEYDDLEDGFFQEGRIAFFAKGKVTGDWLLTVAYDTDKEKEEVGRRLMQVIDPDEYFTLYGDATQQGYDAASSEKLYVKIERKNFYALYGDYETALNTTELSAYNRTLTGLHTEYHGDRVRANAFLSNTNQLYERDEIQGDGTSGLYRLSQRHIIIGSDRITVETRDRFRSEFVLSERTLTPQIDYDINYLDGTLFFREPIPSRDHEFNPVYIVAEYEAESDDFEDLTGGGRLGGRLLDGDLDFGASVIHEGAGQESGNLIGVDGRYQLNDATRLRAEVALSRTESYGDDADGKAYLVELEHNGEHTRARVYVREQDSDFGLNQQNASERGTRKYGADVTRELSDEWLVDGSFFRHENLRNGAVRNVAEASGRFSRERYGGLLGLRYVNEDKGDVTQLFTSAHSAWFDGRWDLHASGEVDVQGGDPYGDYGNRLLLGTDFKVTHSATLFAEHEFLWTDGRDAMDTRAGFRIAPWQGGRINTAYHRESTENGLRSFANLGLNQSFSLGEHWSFSASLDRSQTIGDSLVFNEEVPPTSGNRTEDFTAVSLGSAYNADSLNVTGRAEYRHGEHEQRWGLFVSALKEHGERTSYAGNLALFATDGDHGFQELETRLRLSLAHRPDDSKWIFLDRLDLEFAKLDNGIFDTNARRIVNHFKANQLLTSKAQIAWQIAAKYVVDTIDDEDYTSAAALFGVELRHTFRPNWDFSLHARARLSFGDDLYDSSCGASIGHAVVKHVWVSVGYNFTGFRDKEFSRNDYTSQGPYVRFRANMDQTTVRKALDYFRKR
jgi:hypothetical protein